MNLYILEYFARCLTCDKDIPFGKAVPSYEDITEPSNEQLMELIEEGREAVCPNCESKGNFDITMILFNGFYYEPIGEPRSGIFRIEIEKANGVVNNVIIEATFQNVTKVDILNGITAIKQTIEKFKSDFENGLSSRNEFIEAGEGSCFFQAKYNEEPPYVEPWGGSNYGLSYSEIYNEINQLEKNASLR